ncbi:MAG: 50S ribosomal protein L22 [Candidatus Brennerbacteria bacterium]|nr:50S ribosomal protein L22 [Candidatus Brennerbacteria bacterium]
MTSSAHAYLRYLRAAPRKTRAVADVIRGLSVSEAEAQLLLMSRSAAMPILKLLRSAAANARVVLKREPHALFVKEIRVDQGPKSKRWMPRARGAMSPIERKTSHVSIVLGMLAAPKPARFTIKEAVKPQEKTGGKKTGTREHDHVHEEREGQESEKRGFAKRVFRRKAV